MSPLILDTGPIVALLDRKDSHHEWVSPGFAKVSGPLVTTGAVFRLVLQDGDEADE